MIARLERAYLRLVRRPDLDPRLRTSLTFVAALVRETLAARLESRAAMLAYWTLVAMVPVLVVLAAAMTPVGGTSAVRDLLYNSFLAGPVRSVGDQLDTWLTQVDFGSLGAAGLVALVFTASRIYMSVEDAYNALWKVSVSRSWLMRVGTFYALLTLTPLLVAYGFHLSGELRVAVNLSFGARLLPVLLTACGFAVAIKALPNASVRVVPAVVGGLGSAVLFEVAKLAFGTYTDRLGAMEAAAAVYGGLALFPIFLLWLYVLWIIVLFGVLLAYVTQHLPDFLAAEARRHEGLALHRRQAEPFFALKCTLVVARRFVEGAGATDEPTLTRALATEPGMVRDAVDVLVKAGVLAEAEAGLLPALPPQTLRAREVLERYRALVRPVGADEGGIDAAVEAMLGPEADRTLAELAACGG